MKVMKVKIGNITYSSNDLPIMVVLSDADKHNITNMDDDCTQYCSYPESHDSEQIKQWMRAE